MPTIARSREKQTGPTIMIYFVDTNVAIYVVENPPHVGPRARAYVNSLKGAGHAFAATEIVRMECRMLPVRNRDTQVLLDFESFFTDPVMKILAVDKQSATRPPSCERTITSSLSTRCISPPPSS